jgi:hypothetical protein
MEFGTTWLLKMLSNASMWIKRKECGECEEVQRAEDR